MSTPQHVFTFALLIASVTAGSRQQKTADPCTEPQSQVDSNRCTAAQYAKAESELNALYGKLVEVMEKGLAESRRSSSDWEIKYMENGLSGLKEAQSAWIAYRKLHCAAARQRFEGGSIMPAIWNSCMKQLTEHRIEELKQAYEDDE